MAQEVNQSGGEVKAFWININDLSQRLKKCTFLPIPCGVGTWLEEVIVQNGGDVIGDDGINAEYTISILDEKYFNDNPDEDYPLPSDCFSSLFIYDIVKAVSQGDKELPNLNEYRLTDTNFVDVDVNKVLFQEKKWTEFTLIPAPVAYSKVTAQEVVRAWKSNDQIEWDPSIDEGNMDINQDQEQSNISHYKLNVEESPNRYTICFETSTTVEQVKQKFAKICDIPANLQRWSGWPEKVTDETPLSACFKNQVDHSLKLSRRAVIKSGPRKEFVHSGHDETNHKSGTSGQIPEQDPLAIRVPVPATDTEHTSVATPPRTPATNTQQQVRVASPGRSPGSTSERRSETTSKHAPSTLTEKAPVDSSKRILFSMPGEVPHTSSPGRAHGTTPERSPGNTPKRANLPTPERAHKNTPERARNAPPDSVALASPVRDPDEDLENISAPCSLNAYPKKRFIIESSSSSSSTISCEIAPVQSPVKQKVTPSKRISVTRSTSKDMSSDCETGVDGKKKNGQSNERSRSKFKTKGPISRNATISSQGSRSKKQMNSNDKARSVHDQQEKRRKSKSLNITDDSETDDEADFKLTNKSKLAPPDTANSNTKKKETSVAKIARLVPVAVAGPSGYQKKSKAGKKPKPSIKRSAAVSSESDLDDLSDPEGSVVKPEGKQFKVYPIEEGQRILDLVCKYNAFLYTSGNHLWKQIEAANLFPGRTFLSLREHYTKKIKKLVEGKEDKTYKISTEDLKRLLKANERFGWNKHRNMCPDYNFDEESI